MREIVTHRDSALNETIDIFALDDPGPGGACHDYEIRYGVGEDNCLVNFQKGALQDQGGVPNGISDEALLTILIDRLHYFQQGAFSCRENGSAVNHLEEAMHWLKHRTFDRMRRGVEGKALA